ncbi:MAG: hypothetical protein AB7V56_07805 [Candidatus Nitrosocosmicus sp.]|uniref:hypothetical protein n=1 Tax=Candidatus Nitrosocosmicus agrestis TaxID=2563600 RepID=UPI00122E2CF1|nr:hypothetical protein [Candidatus Nitrosocosmicus sp. SS]KAA2281245.1 hypothetical protein F1Z66_08995 [Candidatus Nitrosocosmicus sp. SS]KAF0867963.1 hypothetical protein E5N71_12700 [Candidatus Nitrosocosmicus sp. SS]MDR4490522.1 hypothetical protein [Candidatus Nitrosocosmicus sp.]
MSKSNIENDWYKRFFSLGNNIGSGRVIDPRESNMYFEDIQHQMNFMFLFLHALSKAGTTAQIFQNPTIREDRALELNNSV